MDEFSSKRLIKDVEHIKRTMASMDKTLALQAASLIEHMKRSEANEKAVSLLAEELKPVQNHVLLVQSVVKFLAWFFASGIAIYIISKYW
jgi:hypothetical protein